MTISLLISACAMLVPPPPPPQATPPVPEDPAAALAATMPHVRVDRENRVVEFDGVVPIDAHIAEAPNLYLEVMICTPDVRAHESLVASRAVPSHVHAALLLIGLEPGRPGSWNWNGERMIAEPPTGPAVDVTFVWTDAEGERHEDLASDWIKNAATGETLTSTTPDPESRWVFAGSRMVSRNGRQWYAAEAEGTIVGLHTFSSETVAWRHVMSPSAEVQDPEWIADPTRVPPRGTDVTVRIRAVDPPEPPAHPAPAPTSTPHDN